MTGSRDRMNERAGRGGLVEVLLSLLLLAAACSSPPSSSPATAGPPGLDVVELTVDEIQADYTSGRYSAEDLTRASLARIHRYEPHYNAIISLNPEAVAQARALDRELESTGSRGPLHGVPVVIKDNIDAAGLVTTAGYDGFSSATGGIDMIPDDDAAVVERLKAAGAVILAKTNLPDFAGHGTRTRSTVAGVTLNPYNTAKAPGGSSGGTATAVNASFAVAGLGTETGGSIQNPASAQALVGVKPTFGLVPLEGVVPMSATYVDVVGPMARTVKDAAYLLDVIAGPSDEDPRTEVARGHLPRGGYVAGLTDRALEGRRFGLVGEGWRTSFLPLDPDTRRLYEEAIGALEDQGARVVEDPFLGSGFIELYRQRRSVRGEGVDEMAAYLQGLGEGAAFHSIEEWESLTGRSYRNRDDRADGSRFDRASDRTPEETPDRAAGPDALTFPEWRAQIQALFREVLDRHDLDGLFFPQAGAPIPDLIEDPDRPDYNPNNHPELPSNIVNDMGLPVVTLPFAYYEDGTPFVLAFIGDVWTEGDLLAFAYALEQATRGRKPPRLTDGAGG